MVVAVGTRFDTSASEKRREEGRSGAKIAETEEADLAESIGPKTPVLQGFFRPTRPVDLVFVAQ